MRIAFVEVWPNSIVRDFTNSLIAQKPGTEIFVVFDSVALKTEDVSPFDKRIKLIPLENARHIRKVAFFPYYLMSFFSEKYRKVYLDSLYVQYYPKLAETLDGIKPDVVQSNLWINPYSIQAARWCRKNKVPFILRTEMQRFPEKPFGRMLTKILMKTSHKVVFDTAKAVIPWTRQEEEFAKREFPMPREKISAAVPPGIDPEKFNPRLELKNKSPKVQFAVVQRFVPYKSYPTVVAAAEILKKAGYSGFEITLKGEGPLKQEIKRLVQAKGLEDVIRFEDRRYGDMAEFYSQFDALILPSSWEAIGLVVPEAMACGLAIIVSDTAGAQVYAEEGKNAMRFRTGDAGDLADRIRKITKAKAEELGKESLKISKDYSLGKMAEKYCDAFASAGLKL